MSVRKIVTASVAAFAAAALSVPVVSAQSSGSDAGELSAESLGGGSLGEGSMDGLSADGSAEGAGSGEGAGSEEGGEGLPSLVPDDGSVCELPGMGGSIAKFYPLFGITGVPTFVLDIVTSALDSFPNVLDLVAGPGGGADLIGQTGSLDEGLCTMIFGGEMVMPPVTVIVDGDGNPITTVTGTVSARAEGAARTATSTSAPTSVSGAAGVSGPTGLTGAADDSGSASSGDDNNDSAGTGAGGGEGSAETLPTTVPTP